MNTRRPGARQFVGRGPLTQNHGSGLIREVFAGFQIAHHEMPREQYQSGAVGGLISYIGLSGEKIVPTKGSLQCVGIIYCGRKSRECRDVNSVKLGRLKTERMSMNE